MNVCFLSGSVDKLRKINGEFGAFAVFTLLEHVKFTKRDGSVVDFDKPHSCFCKDVGLVDGVSDGDEVVVEGRMDAKQAKNGDGSDVLRQWSGNGRSGESKVYEPQIAVTAVRPLNSMGDDDLDF